MARLLTDHLLSVLILLPSAAAVALAFFPERAKGAVRGFTLAVSGVGFVLAARLFMAFRPDAGFQFNESADWIPSFNIHWFVGVDGISLLMVLLTNFLMPVVILSSTRLIQEHVKAYHIAFLVLQTGMLGSFLALDLFLFYIFWELMLIPMYFIIGIWGGKNRVYAAVKFFIYTMVGSLLMLIAIMFVYFKAGAGDFNITRFFNIGLDPASQTWLFLAFALAFAIKVPMFPLHTWLPDAHTEAPTAGSVILAAVLLKMGTYGFVRFAMPLFPDATAQFTPLIATLAVIGVIYAALVAMVQEDVKKLVAYSSVAHLGFVMLGVFALNQQGIAGGMLQMLNHGVSTGALFLIVGFIYERRHTRLISDFGGLSKQMPIFATVFMIVTLSSIGLPGTNGFVGEFLILIGAFESELRWWTVIASSGVILSAVYMLWMFQRVMFGELSNPKNQVLKDLNAREIVVMAPLIVLIFVMGVYPTPFIDKMNPAIEKLISQTKQKQIAHLAVPVQAPSAPAVVPAAPAMPAGHPALPPGHPAGEPK